MALPAFAAGRTRSEADPDGSSGSSPPEVKGTHFRVGEKVGVTLGAGKTKILRTVRVSGKGEFTVVFGTVTRSRTLRADRSSLVVIGALGEKIGPEAAADRLPGRDTGQQRRRRRPETTTSVRPPTSRRRRLTRARNLGRDEAGRLLRSGPVVGLREPLEAARAAGSVAS